MIRIRRNKGEVSTKKEENNIIQNKKDTILEEVEKDLGRPLHNPVIKDISFHMDAGTPYLRIEVTLVDYQ